MVRFLKSLCEEFTTQAELDRFMAIENIANFLYIPASMLIALSALGKYDIIPYATKQPWGILLPASVYLTVANTRDLHICTSNFFLPRDAKSRSHRTLLGQMQLASSLFMTLGSISLLNSCIIGILHFRSQVSELSENFMWQYAVSFGLFVTGSAANTVPLSPEFAQYNDSRALLTFQHIIASALFCLEGFLMLPGLVSKESLDFRDTLVASFAVIASIILLFSSVVNYFHNMGLLQAYRRFIEQDSNHKDSPENEKRDSDPEGLFGRFWGFLGFRSRNEHEHENYDEVEYEHLYEAEALLMSDSSSVASNWNDAVDESVEVDVEEGERRSDIDERRYKHGRRKNKRKGRNR